MSKDNRKNHYDKTYTKMLSDGKLTGTILDPKGVLKGSLNLAGVYIWSIIDLQTLDEYAAYIGETNDLQLRTKEHLKHWFYNDQQLHYLGILTLELGTRYVLKLTAFTDPAGIAYSSKKKRLAEEKLLIDNYKPYTQYSEDISKKIYPNVYDSCLWHRYRREAFLNAIANAGK